MKSNRPEHILIVCQAWHGEKFGGSYKLASEAAKHLASQGYRVHYLCGSKQAGGKNPTKEEGVLVWRYRLPKGASPSPFNLIGHLWSTWRMTRRLARIVPITVLNGHSPIQFLAAAVALRGHACAKTYSLHSPFVEEMRAKWGADGSALSVKRRIALAVFGSIERMSFARADTVQCFSNYSAALAAEGPNGGSVSKTVVCPGWVDVERFKPDDRSVARTVLGFPWRPVVPTFLTVRRLQKRMGLHELLEAAAQLRDEGFQFRVLIGGSGPLRGSIRREIRQKGLGDFVALLGRIPEKSLPLCYAAADCYVLPTKSLECFGLTTLEAYAAGTPVIATPIGAIPEVMGPMGRDGWLTGDTSSGSIADRMRAFLRGDLATDAAALRQRAMEYSASRILPRLEKVVAG